MDEITMLQTEVEGALKRIITSGGSDNRITIQGDQGFIVVKGACDEEDVEVLLASGRTLNRQLEDQAAQRLYDHGFRRKTAALPFTKLFCIDEDELREALAHLLIDLVYPIYASDISKVSLHERFADRSSTENNRLIEAMKRLSKKRDMSSRQKLYWAVVRSQVLLALDSPPPKSLKTERGLQQWIESGLNDIQHVSSSLSIKNFKEITAYRSVAIFTDPDALDLIDPRGIESIVLPGRLAIMLALAQSWDSLLINPRSAVGGELYKNELQSILEGLERMGW